MESKRKKRKIRNIIFLIADAVIILIVGYFILGYLNLYKISEEKAPVFEGEINNYQENGGNVTVHDYKLYKVVKYEIPNKRVTYSMKLWFMDDVKSE